MLSRAQNTFHHNPRLRGPVSSVLYFYSDTERKAVIYAGGGCN